MSHAFSLPIPSISQANGGLKEYENPRFWFMLSKPFDVPINSCFLTLSGVFLGWRTLSLLIVFYRIVNHIKAYSIPLRIFRESVIGAPKDGQKI